MTIHRPEKGVKRTLRERKSGRRGSNPRQPAWEADRRDIAARLLSSGFRRALTNRTRHTSTIEADGRLRWGADGYLLSLQSYPLLLKKASSIGKKERCSMRVCLPPITTLFKRGFAEWISRGVNR